MNNKLSKLINRYARVLGLQPRDLRKKFLSLSLDKQEESRKAMIRSLFDLLKARKNSKKEINSNKLVRTTELILPPTYEK